MSEVTGLTREKKRSLLEVVLASGFMGALSTALIVYINSSFLETLIPEKLVGILFAAAYAITLLLIEYYGRIIARFKNHVVLLTAFGLQIIALLVMAWNQYSAVSITAFVVLVVMYNVTVINYDVMLEALTTPKETGRMRGVFWTVINLAYVFGPFISGALVGYYGFSMAYTVGAIVMIPAWLMIFFAYKKNGSQHYKKHRPFKKTLAKVLRDKNLRGIFIVAFMLYFFYSWMVIYTPIYLLEIGFTWDKIGQIFTVMLVPFVLLEYPAGWLADKYIGETELLTVGFSFMGLAVLALTMVSGFWGIMIVLFCSRIGASLVEIMRDTYFYKKVDADDLDLIDAYRNTRSLAYVIGPLLASGLLALGFLTGQLFIVLGILLILATVLPMTIEDTK